MQIPNTQLAGRGLLRTEESKKAEGAVGGAPNLRYVRAHRPRRDHLVLSLRWTNYRREEGKRGTMSHSNDLALSCIGFQIAVMSWVNFVFID